MISYHTNTGSVVLHSICVFVCMHGVRMCTLPVHACVCAYVVCACVGGGCGVRQRMHLQFAHILSSHHQGSGNLCAHKPTNMKIINKETKAGVDGWKGC